MKNKIVFSLLTIIVIWALILVFTSQNKKCDEPIVTFTFDDGYEDQYAVAFPIFMEYNIAATTYIIAGLVGGQFENETLMDWGQIKELQDNGWEIGSHTATHRDLTELDKEPANYELEKSKLMLEEQGFAARSISIPYGKYNDGIIGISKEYYESVRTSDWGLNKLGSINKYNLKSFSLMNSTPLSEIKSWIDEAENRRGWAIIMVHHVRTNLSREFSAHPDDIAGIIDYIKEKGIEVKTISEVLDQCG